MTDNTDNGERLKGAAGHRLSGGLALLAGAAAIALAGCGGATAPPVASVATTSSSNPHRSTNATGGAAGSSSAPNQAQLQEGLLKYAQCMRANGVPNFPDPSGGGFLFRAGAGIDPASPAFTAAQAKCEKFIGAGALAPGTRTHPSAQWLAMMVKASQCMRRHGVPTFPDPTTTLPSPKVLGGGGQISDIDGAVLVFPAATIDTRSPLFTRAAKACNFPLHNH
jgi:hypothetical protein